MSDLTIERSQRLDRLSARLTNSVSEHRAAVRRFATRVALAGTGTFTVAEAITALSGNENTPRNAMLAVGVTVGAAVMATVWETAENGPDVLFGLEVRSDRRALASFQAAPDVQSGL